MKKTHIALLFLIAFGFIALAAMLSGSASYAGFADARLEPDQKVRVAGTLVPGKDVIYDPQVDPNSFTFWMQDRDGGQSKVICNQDMPYDFEKSQEVVLTGQMRDDVFIATDLLVKCPSKYTEEEIDKKQS
ncbi:MAG: cytochrome c-type biogenesis protein CcmE [Limisphaerales bacterium]